MEMDSETGERCRDSETGEWVPLPLPYNNEYDDETGEPASTTECATFLPKRSTFKIHPCYMKHSARKFYPTMPSTRDMSPALLFLLPTLFVYPGITSIIIAILEVVIHTWAHRVNKRLADKNVYYKSPMHIIASEFCAKCRDIKTMDKIEKLQDKRTLRFKCHYEYVKRIVT